MHLRSSTSSNIPSTSICPDEADLPNDVEYNIPVKLPQPGGRKLELWQQQPAVSPVKGVEVKLKLDINRYRAMEEKKFSNPSDIEARKIVLGMIKEHEELWAFKRLCVPREKWEEFAVKHYLRTGNMSHDIHIRTIWGAAKKELIDILTKSIRSRDTKQKTEDKLKEWELYPHIVFYRAVTREYEVELKKRVNSKPCNRDVIENTLAFVDVVTSYQDVQEDDGTVHQKLVVEPPLTIDETDTGTTRKICAPIRKTGLSMTLQEYRALKDEQFEKRKDLEMKKLIIAVIEEFPGLWEHRKVRALRCDWERVAIELFLRTEVILSVELIRKVFNDAKERLRKELQFSQLKKLTLHETELKLDRWDLYQQMKFFREAMLEHDINVNVEKVFEDDLVPDRPGDDGQPGFFNPVQPQSGPLDPLHSSGPLVLDSHRVVGAGEAPELNMDPQNNDVHSPADNDPTAPLYPKLPVPDKIDGLTMTLDEYKKSKDFVKKTDLDTTKKIIAVLETHKELWERKGVAMPLEKWQNLAADVYLRTSYLIKVQYIRDVWRRVKDQLRGKIRPTLMAKDETTFKAALSRLRNWELYEQVKFFRVVMREYEEETKKKQRGEAYNADLVDDEDPFADIIYLEKVAGTPQTDMTLYPNAHIIERKPQLGQIEMEEEEEEEAGGLEKIRIPGPRAGAQMTIDEYRALEDGEFDNQTDARTKKYVLCLIEKTPALWCRRNIKTTVEQWEELAVEFYIRTGSSMSVDHIRSIWANLKKSLRKRLQKPLDSYKIEEELKKWEFYLQMKFYRKIMKDVEDARQKKLIGEEYDDDVLNEPTAFDDIVIWKIKEGTGIFPNPIKMERNYGAGYGDFGAYAPPVQLYDYHHTDNRVEEKPFHRLDFVEDQGGQEEVARGGQDVHVVAQPQNAEPDHIAEAEFAMDRLLDLANDRYGGADNVLAAFLEAYNRPNRADGVTMEFLNLIHESVTDRVNEHEGGKENRPAGV